MRMLRGKRLLSLLLCLVMVLSFFPTAYAEGEGGEITLEDEHDHEGEDQGMIAPVNEEPVGAIQESPEEEIDDDYAGNETLAAPETGDLVRVEFICDPEDTVITVYDPAKLNDEGEPEEILPEVDGSWLLVPGEYLYDAHCDGYWDVVEETFEIDQISPTSVVVQLIPIEYSYVDCSDLMESQEYERVGTIGSQTATGGVRTKLDAVLAQYPDGSYWKDKFDGGYQCYGFAKLVVYQVFGTSSSGKYRSWYYDASKMTGMILVDQVATTTEENVQQMLSKARPGDVLQFASGSNGKHQHSMVVYDLIYSGSTVKGAKIYECNWYGSSGSCKVTLRTLTNAEIAKRQTRSDGTKRGKLSLLTADNWDTVNGGSYATTYTVTYNANGGNWAPSSQTKTHGVDLTLATAHPARSSDSAGSYTVSLDPNGGTVEKTSYSVPRTNDYTFRNWNTKADGSGTSYEAGGTYSANASVTLYAQYDRTTRTSSIKLPTPSRNGAAFLGWATSPSASSGVTGSYTPPGNVTLYAIWSYETPKLWLSSSSIQLDVVTKPTQKINYYYSGDTANGYYLSSEIAYSSIPNVIQYSWGSGEECVIITGLRAGHAYLQISLVEYNTGNILYSALCEVTVTDPRSYTIRYDANGGYGAPASQTKTHNVDINLNGSEPKRDSEYGETLTLRFDANGGTVEPSEMTAQKITWYSFDSWNTARDGSGTKYYGGSSYSGNANLTLYAQWDSGTSSTSFVLPEPTRQGYRFIGWAAIPGGEPRYAAGAKVTLRDSGTIYAIWEAIRLPGDVNGDGVVNGTDLIRLRRYLAGENVEIVAENADVNGDGTINGMDLIRLRKYLAGEAVDLK